PLTIVGMMGGLTLWMWVHAQRQRIDYRNVNDDWESNDTTSQPEDADAAPAGRNGSLLPEQMASLNTEQMALPPDRVGSLQSEKVGL
ncbi:MAG: hypothetical protein ACOX61_04045, partial [Brooklawnia sp.]